MQRYSVPAWQKDLHGLRDAIQEDGRKSLERQKIFFGKHRAIVQHYVSPKTLTEITRAAVGAKEHVLSSVRLTEQPELIVGGEMRDYQLKGLEFLLTMFDRGVNAIVCTTHTHPHVPQGAFSP